MNQYFRSISNLRGIEVFMCMFFDKRKTRQYDETTELTEMEN